MGVTNSIRNKDGYWINSAIFTEEAAHFQKYGYYCAAPEDSIEYEQYWEEQLRRCIEGYSSGGGFITGHHYNYLNFSRIKKSTGSGKKSRSKEAEFPSFYDGDYDYYHIIDIARYGCTEEHLKGLQLENNPLQIDGGHHLIVGKARRKGYSYKNAAIVSNVYNTDRDSISLLGAYESKYLYPEGTMAMVMSNLNFINQHTAWGKKRDFVNQIAHIKASFKEEERGVPVEKGYKSQVICATFNANSEAAKGKDATLVLFEEAGVFDNLKASYLATKSTVEDGIYTTGQLLVFGTGGNMDSGSKDFSEMFYSPEQFNALSFENIWDEDSSGTFCSFFVPQWKNKTGLIDEQGNSLKKEALEYDNNIRIGISKSANSSGTLVSHAQENPNSPAEAFVIKSFNDFPIQELNARLSQLKRDNKYIIYGQPVYLQKVEGKASIRPDLKNELKPLWFKNDRGEGCVVIYEAPITAPPRNMYCIGYDPYRQDIGTSNAGVYVYKKANGLSQSQNKIVASFIGRPKTFDTCNYIVELLSELYNCDIMYENEVPDVVTYFRNRNKLHYLALQPDSVISSIVGNSKVKRIYGMHMTDKIKDAGEKYIKKWLLTIIDYDEHGNEITNLDRLEDVGLIEELIKYSRKTNSDRVMAFMQILFQLESDTNDDNYTNREDTEESIFDRLINLTFNNAN